VGVIDVLDREIELILVSLGVAAVFRRGGARFATPTAPRPASAISLPWGEDTRLSIS